MRAAAVQLTSTPDLDRNLEAADRLTRAAAAPRRGARRAAGEVARARHARADRRRGASRSTGSALDAGRAASRASSASTSWPARSPSASRAPSAARTPAVHIGPDGEDRAVYRKIHMFDVEVGGRTYRESEHEAPGDELVLSETADGTELGLTHLLRPALPGALPRSSRSAARRCSPSPAAFTRDDDARALGGAPARAGDRGPVLRDRRQPGRRARRRGSAPAGAR